MTVFGFEPLYPADYQTGRMSIVCVWKSGGMYRLVGQIVRLMALFSLESR